ncbi:Branched-chain amino acid ABC-type transport system, permease components [Ewingella americana]|uniref:Branched-chain amino acid ABC-type transport system, permease components n=1 Tax=Ewingella americana TaxID=41202 RepID=A0A377TFL3_9GAMM|nr:Branched-chain amino acid ABC-type transport system, permease components [Ewingella americana]
MENTMMRQIHNVLILGAGELGMAMLAGFIKQRESHPELQLTVLLRPASLAENASAGHKRRVQKFAKWGVATLAADFSTQSEDELAQVFAPYDAIVNCSGFVGGTGTQLKISRAALQAGVARYFPWQFGVDYDQIGGRQRAAGVGRAVGGPPAITPATADRVGDCLDRHVHQLSVRGELWSGGYPRR